MQQTYSTAKKWLLIRYMHAIEIFAKANLQIFIVVVITQEVKLEGVLDSGLAITDSGSTLLNSFIQLNCRFSAQQTADNTVRIKMAVKADEEDPWIPQVRTIYFSYVIVNCCSDLMYH